MKKLKLALIAVALMFSLSGCIRYNTTIEFKSNGKANVEMTYAMMSMSMGDDDEEDEEDESLNESMDEMRDKGWSVEKYNEDGYSGLRAVKKDIDFEEISKEISNAEGDMDLETDAIKLKKEGSTYIFDWKFEGESADESKQYESYIAQNGGYMTFTIKLPKKAKNHNATTVKDGGKTLEWDLLALDSTNGIHVEFQTGGSFIFVIIFIVAAVVVIAIAVAAVVIIKKKK